MNLESFLRQSRTPTLTGEFVANDFFWPPTCPILESKWGRIIEEAELHQWALFCHEVKVGYVFIAMVTDPYQWLPKVATPLQVPVFVKHSGAGKGFGERNGVFILDEYVYAGIPLSENRFECVRPVQQWKQDALWSALCDWTSSLGSTDVPVVSYPLASPYEYGDKRMMEPLASGAVPEGYYR